MVVAVLRALCQEGLYSVLVVLCFLSAPNGYTASRHCARHAGPQSSRRAVVANGRQDCHGQCHPHRLSPHGSCFLFQPRAAFPRRTRGMRSKALSISSALCHAFNIRQRLGKLTPKHLPNGHLVLTAAVANDRHPHWHQHRTRILRKMRVPVDHGLKPTRHSVALAARPEASCPRWLILLHCWGLALRSQ